MIVEPDLHPRDVLRGLRAALSGAGPALALGGDLPRAVPADTAIVVTTSGSTGKPKSVALSRSAITASAMATAERLGEGRWLLALPADRIAGVQVLARSIIQGDEPAVLSGSFTPASFVAAAQSLISVENGQEAPLFTSLVPAQLELLLGAAGDEKVRDALRSFEAILVGGQRLPRAVAARATELGVRVVRTYGSTETAGGCVYDGAPLDGVAMKIVEGELLIASPTLASGYIGNDALTASMFITDAEGKRWFRTGDAGEIHDGILTVSGRIDNVIISGGVNISLDLVENSVRELDGLSSAVVIGAPSERWGEQSVVVTDSPNPPSLDDIRSHVAAELGKESRPARILSVEEVPLLASGKPDRQLLTRAVLSMLAESK